MSYQCSQHGWSHLLNPCPLCPIYPVSIGSTHYHPQTYSPGCLKCQEDVVDRHYDLHDRILERDTLRAEIDSFKSGVQTFKCPSCKQSGIPFYEVNLQTEIKTLQEQLKVAKNALEYTKYTLENQAKFKGIVVNLVVAGMKINEALAYISAIDEKKEIKG